MAWCVICTAAVGPWGLLALLPAVLVAVFILVGFVRRRRRPIDAVVGRLSNEMWAWQSAMAAHDPRLDQVTASMVVRAPLRRRLPRR